MKRIVITGCVPYTKVGDIYYPANDDAEYIRVEAEHVDPLWYNIYDLIKNGTAKWVEEEELPVIEINDDNSISFSVTKKWLKEFVRQQIKEYNKCNGISA